jgi:hypothetical protein
VQRDILSTLTDRFAQSRYSLKSLLAGVLTHEAFNLKMPDQGCGSAPHALPAFFDAWTRDDPDVAKQPNSSADGIYPLSSRVLARTLHRAMQWPSLPSFPSTQEEVFQSSIGFFISNSNPGFRGLEMQARLSWEEAYGSCTHPGLPDDFISNLASQAAQTPGSTLRDAIVALKDRLTGEPRIADAEEQAALEALAGSPLDAPVDGELANRLRLVCGVLVSSPQFMLGGAAPVAADEVPALTPPDGSAAAVCEEIADYFESSNTTYRIACDGGQIGVLPHF